MSGVGITHVCFGASYGCAWGLEVAQAYWPRRWLRGLGLALGVAGLTAHTLYLSWAAPPLASATGALLVLAWVLAVFYLVGTVHHRKTAWAVFVLPVVFALTLLSAVTAASPAQSAASADAADWGMTFGSLHGLLVLGAAVGVSVAFLASVMYLVQAQRLRAKVAPGQGVRLLSLERLELMARRALNVAFPLLTAGLIVGVALVPNRPHPADAWSSPRVVGTAGLWLVFLMMLYLRYAAHTPARRLAWLTVLAFVLLLATLAAAHPFAPAGAGGQ